MEHLVVTLPEDFSQVTEEIMQIVLDLCSLSIASVDKLVDIFTGSEGISPLLSAQSKLELVLSDF